MNYIILRNLNYIEIKLANIKYLHKSHKEATHASKQPCCPLLKTGLHSSFSFYGPHSSCSFYGPFEQRPELSRDGKWFGVDWINMVFIYPNLISFKSNQLTIPDPYSLSTRYIHILSTLFGFGLDLESLKSSIYLSTSMNKESITLFEHIMPNKI